MNIRAYIYFIRIIPNKKAFLRKFSYKFTDYLTLKYLSDKFLWIRQYMYIRKTTLCNKFSSQLNKYNSISELNFCKLQKNKIYFGESTSNNDYQRILVKLKSSGHWRPN